MHEPLEVSPVSRTWVAAAEKAMDHGATHRGGGIADDVRDDTPAQRDDAHAFVITHPRRRRHRG